MTQTAEVNEQMVDDARVEAEVALKRQLFRAYKQLTESLLCDDDNYVNPNTPFTDDGERWTLAGQATQNDPRWPFNWLSEAELTRERNLCRNLSVYNEFAINGHENRVSYIVGEGHRCIVAPVAESGTDGEAAADTVRDILTEFMRENKWQRRQQENQRRLDRDGEVFLRIFEEAGGKVRIRYVEPYQVTEPERVNDATFGILCDTDDAETPLTFFVDGEPIDASEIQHRKANVDLNCKRGSPLFRAVRKNLQRADKLLRNMMTVADVQTRIALIRKHSDTSPATLVEQFAQAQKTATGIDASGQPRRYEQIPAGAILDTRGFEYDFPAGGLDMTRFIEVLKAELRAVASRLVMPEFMLTSDASNANYASTMVSEGPAVKFFKRQQAEMIEWDMELFRRVIDRHVTAGALPENVYDLVTITLKAPKVEVRDQLADAQANQILLQAGILSPQTWSASNDLVYDTEAANITRVREALLKTINLPPLVTIARAMPQPLPDFTTIPTDGEGKPLPGGDGKPVIGAPVDKSHPEPIDKTNPEMLATADTALNGAQVSAATSIVQMVAQGQLPRDAGVGQLIQFFNLTQAQAERCMGTAGKGFVPQQAPSPPAAPPAKPDAPPPTTESRLGAALSEFIRTYP